LGIRAHKPSAPRRLQKICLLFKIKSGLCFTVAILLTALAHFNTPIEQAVIMPLGDRYTSAQKLANSVGAYVLSKINL